MAGSSGRRKNIPMELASSRTVVRSLRGREQNLGLVIRQAGSSGASVATSTADSTESSIPTTDSTSQGSASQSVSATATSATQSTQQSAASSDTATSTTDSSSTSAASTTSAPALSSNSPTSASSSSDPPSTSSSQSPSASSSPPSTSALPSSTSSYSPSPTTSQDSSSQSQSALPSSSSPTPIPTSSSSSTQTNTPTPNPTSSSSSFSAQTTITSAIVETVNGHTTTTYELIPTTLSTPDTSNSAATNRAIIAGSVVGVTAFLALALAMVMFYKRHQVKKLSFFKRKETKTRSMLLAEEDMDDLDLGPPMQGYRDYPGSFSTASRATSYNASSLNGAPMAPNASTNNVRTPARYSPSSGRNPSPSTSPHLMGMRTSESGSIFQEAVWPPPRSQMVDPLTSQSSDDLTRIVDDIMGPAGSQGPNTPPGLGSGAAHTSQSSSDLGMPPGHARSPSETALLAGNGPESPRKSTWQSPLFVTNMGAETASINSNVSPPPSARRLPTTLHEEGEELSMGEAI